MSTNSEQPNTDSFHLAEGGNEAACEVSAAEVQRVTEALDAMKAEAVDQNIAEGKMSRIVWEAQALLINPCTQVYFRAGLIACREYMARFVEAESPSIAASIRANWWPQLGEDFGAPRLLAFSEVADGGEEGPWTVKPVSPTLEALPLALNFLEKQA